MILSGQLGTAQLGAAQLGNLTAAGSGGVNITGSIGTVSAYAIGCPGAANVNGDISLFGCSGGTPSAEVSGIGGALAVAPNVVGSVGCPSAYAAGVGGIVAPNPGIFGSYGTVSAYKAGFGGSLITFEFTLFIAGVRRGWLDNTLNVNQPLSQAATASFDLWDKTGLLRFDVGQEVLIYHNNLRIFGGTIDDKEELAKPFLSGTFWVIKCVDFSNILDRHVTARYYSASSAALDIMVSDITTNELSADGIIYDSSDGDPPGIVAGPQLFPAQTVRQIFNAISTLFQWDFNIDYYKVLRFFPKNAGRGTAPFTISDGDSNVLSDPYAKAAGTTSIGIRTYRTAYRNVQYVTSSGSAGSQWQDIFSTAIPGPFPNSPQPPDGTRFFFVTKYGLISKPSVTVNGVAQRVVSFTDFPLPSNTWDWYWIPQQGAPNPSPGVGQNLANPRLTSSDVLIVNYATNIPPLISVSCPAQIAARAAIEGNSGIYADVQPASNVTDPGAMTAYASGLLDRYGCLDGMPSQVVYSTLKGGVFAGMVQNIQRSHPLIPSAIRQVSNVSFRDVDGQYLVYTITADSGRYQGNAADFFGQIQNALNLPPPQNRMVYQWQIYPTVPGVNPNPGGTGGVQLQIQVIANPIEIFQFIVVGLATPLTQDLDVAIIENGNTTGSFTIPAGTSAAQTFYYTSNTPYPAGTLLQVFVNPHGTIKDVTVQLVTSVVVSA